MPAPWPDSEELLQHAHDALSKALANNPSPELTDRLTKALQRIVLCQRANSNATKH